jgi:hypothetical protein
MKQGLYELRVLENAELYYSDRAEQLKREIKAMNGDLNAYANFFKLFKTFETFFSKTPENFATLKSKYKDLISKWESENLIKSTKKGETALKLLRKHVYDRLRNEFDLILDPILNGYISFLMKGSLSEDETRAIEENVQNPQFKVFFPGHLGRAYALGIGFFIERYHFITEWNLKRIYQEIGRNYETRFSVSYLREHPMEYRTNDFRLTELEKRYGVLFNRVEQLEIDGIPLDVMLHPNEAIVLRSSLTKNVLKPFLDIPRVEVTILDFEWPKAKAIKIGNDSFDMDRLHYELNWEEEAESLDGYSGHPITIRDGHLIIFRPVYIEGLSEHIQKIFIQHLADIEKIDEYMDYEFTSDDAATYLADPPFDIEEYRNIRTERFPEVDLREAFKNFSLNASKKVEDFYAYQREKSELVQLLRQIRTEQWDMKRLTKRFGQESLEKAKQQFMKDKHERYFKEKYQLGTKFSEEVFLHYLFQKDGYTSPALFYELRKKYDDVYRMSEDDVTELKSSGTFVKEHLSDFDMRSSVKLLQWYLKNLRALKDKFLYVPIKLCKAPEASEKNILKKLRAIEIFFVELKLIVPKTFPKELVKKFEFFELGVEWNEEAEWHIIESQGHPYWPGQTYSNNMLLSFYAMKSSKGLVNFGEKIGKLSVFNEGRALFAQEEKSFFYELPSVDIEQKEIDFSEGMDIYPKKGSVLDILQELEKKYPWDIYVTDPKAVAKLENEYMNKL